MTGAEPLGLDVEKADPEARSARCWRIRSLIVFLVLACLLPVMAGVAFFFFLKYEVDRDRLEMDRVASARALMQVVDSHLEAAKVSAMAISSAGSLGPVHSSRFVFTFWNLDVGHESTDVER